MTQCKHPNCACERPDDCTESAAVERNYVGTIIRDLRHKAARVNDTQSRDPYHERVRDLHAACTPARILLLCDEIERAR